MSAGTESISAVAATDAPRVAAMPRMNSQYRRDLEDLLWSHTQAVAAPDIDFDGLANLSLEQWDTRRRRSRSHEGFRTFTRRLLTPSIPVTAEVLVTGKLECSLAEAAALLRCPGEADFSAAMSNMHGRAFQRGSVVHNFISSRNEVVALFDSDERWCFLEKFTPLRRGLDASRNGFTISQRSLQPDILPRAVRPPIELVRRSRGLGFKRSNKRTHQLAGLSLGYFVETKAAISVLEELVAVLDEGVNRVLAHTNVGIAFDSRYPELDITITLQRLQAQFVREVLPLEACVLANAVTRAYPIDTSGGGNVAAIPVGPIPPNEAYRLEAIAQEQLLLARGCDGLKLICELATRELSCASSLVTIIGRTLQYVLATDFIPLQDAELPREHTLCQHLLMGDRPMLVQHPEADVRFCNLSLVVDYSVQFYAGFPIFSQDGLSVVGSLCCLDDRSREMTQSQYSTLLHLTRAASNIIATQCRQALSLQPLHKRG
ncbi:hypothetical protein PRNP1_005161 [Phytophthora ramorum]